MSDAFVGMNLVEVQKSAKEFDRAALTLRSVGQAMDRILPTIPWAGRTGELFRQEWSSSRKLLTDGAQTMSDLTKAMVRNWQEQADASNHVGSALAPPHETSRHGMSAESSHGFIIRGVTESNNEVIYFSDGTANTEVSVATETRVDFGDAAKLFKILAMPKELTAGVAEDAAGLSVSFDGHASIERAVVTYGWSDRSAGEAGNINSHYATKQADAGNQFWAGGEFGDDDVRDSIRSGEVSSPDMKRVTSESSTGSLTLGVGGQGRGAEVTFESEVQRFASVNYTTGEYSSGFSFESTEANGVQLFGADLGPFGVAAGVESVNLQGGSIEVIRDGEGHVIRIESNQRVGASQGFKLDVSGFYGSSSTSEQIVDRHLVFDLSDPAVRSAFGAEPDLGTAIERMQVNSGLASETLVLRSGGSERDSVGVWTGGGGTGTSGSTTTGAAYRAAGSAEFVAQ